MSHMHFPQSHSQTAKVGDTCLRQVYQVNEFTKYQPGTDIPVDGTTPYVEMFPSSFPSMITYIMGTQEDFRYMEITDHYGKRK